MREMKVFLDSHKFFCNNSHKYLGKCKFIKSSIGEHLLFDGYEKYNIKELLYFPIAYIKFMYLDIFK